MKHCILPIITSALLFTGCASIVSKSQYPVSIKSNPPGAAFTIRKANGETISSGTTPCTVVLNSSAGYFQPAKYLVQFTKGGATKTIPLSASIDGWYFGNILLGGWGLIGIVVIDPASGAMWRLNDSVTATFEQTAQAKKELRVYSINEIPKSWKASLVALN